MTEEAKQPFDTVITDPDTAKKMKYENKCPHCGENTLVSYGSIESGFVDNDTHKMIPSCGKWWDYHCTNKKCKKTSEISDELYTKI